MSDKYKRDLSVEVMVGFFMFLVLVGLGFFTIILSRDNLFQTKYPIEVRFDDVGGLRETDQVFLRGTRVGVVRSTRLENDHVTVRADLDIEPHLREGYRIEVIDSSMLGGKMMKIHEGPIGAPAVAPGTVITGMPPVSVLEELGVAVAGIREMTEQIAAGEGTLGMLVRDETLYGELVGIAGSLREVTSRLERGEGTIGRLMTDDAVYEDVKALTSDLREMSARLVAGKGLLGQLLSDEETALDADLGATLAGIRSIVTRIEEGEGTLGRLVADDALYEEARKLLTEVRAAIDDMRETSPVTTFSTILFGAF